MQKLAFVLLFILAAVLPGTGRLTAQANIVVATDATWPPMEFIAEDGSVAGFDVELLTEAARAGGFQVTFLNVAWDGIFEGLLSGKYDAVASSVTITSSRQEVMDFSAAYINAGQMLVVSSDEDPNAGLANLNGKAIGAQIGTTGESVVRGFPSVRLRGYDDIDKAFADLALGKLSGVVVDLPLAVQYANRDSRYQGRFRMAGKLLNVEEYGVAVRKGNLAVLDLINKGLTAVFQSDVYASLFEKWLDTRGMVNASR